MTSTTRDVSSFWRRLSEKWQGITALVGVGSLCLVIGATGMGIVQSPEMARANRASIASMVATMDRHDVRITENTEDIEDLVDTQETIRDMLNELLIGQCLMRAEMRGQVTDRCRQVLNRGGIP